ncbi:hypothetical protein K2173_018537 [Erythroxylum novogranatense]|uniref:NAC domain-containing protein n=1 Tax=Erythroxylum novogranatense TaxID=1862640 RepID=A0AAV8UDE2_9ROSI|nr:hypothetical protein K2173_018537 [Erythroxylum novogranatense]
MEDLAPGFRFFPTEEELVSFYLRHRLDGDKDPLNRDIDRVIPILDIYDYNPWDLPQLSGDLCRGDSVHWFFFVPRKESEFHGGKPNRLTKSGYWKASGCLGYVYSLKDNRPIGLKRTMIFYQGRAPNGRKTEWKINEYKAIQTVTSSGGSHPELRNELSLCRLYKKSKCLRSFDRRPAKEVKIKEPEVQHAQATGDHHDPGATLTLPSLVVPPIEVVNYNFDDILSTPRIPFFADQCQTFQTSEHRISMDMDIDIGPLWDWQQLD